MGHRPDNDSRARITELGRAYADALLAGDGVGAETAIREAMDAKLTAAEIDDEIIAPALWLVGDLWERGRDLRGRRARRHRDLHAGARPVSARRSASRQARGDHRVLLAAPPDEQHVVALRMVDELLREAGYDVVMLGADVPTEALTAAVSRRRPHVVCLTSTMPSGSGPGPGRRSAGCSGAGPQCGSSSVAAACRRACSRGRGSTSAGASPTWSRPSTRWSRAPA